MNPSSSSSTAALFTHGPLSLNRETHEVSVNGRFVDLTLTEFKLLAILLERRGEVQSRETLLTEVWGYTTWVDTRTADTHMSRLRKKLGEASESIETVRGFGFKLRPIH